MRAYSNRIKELTENPEAGRRREPEAGRADQENLREQLVDSREQSFLE